MGINVSKNLRHLAGTRGVKLLIRKSGESEESSVHAECDPARISGSKSRLVGGFPNEVNVEASVASGTHNIHLRGWAK